MILTSTAFKVKYITSVDRFKRAHFDFGNFSDSLDWAFFSDHSKHIMRIISDDLSSYLKGKTTTIIFQPNLSKSNNNIKRSGVMGSSI